MVSLKIENVIFKITKLFFKVETLVLEKIMVKGRSLTECSSPYVVCYTAW